MDNDLDQTLDITKMKVPDLKRELKMRGLSTSGNKTDLVERLQGVLKAKFDDTVAESVDDLEEDLLNDDDDEHFDGTESVITDIDTNLDVSANLKVNKRKAEEEETKEEVKPAKKIVLNRTSSATELQSAPEEDNTKEAKPEEKKVIKLSELSIKERLEMRAKKFGVTITGDAKKLARAERFGVNSTGSGSTDTFTASSDVLKQRAERFGLVTSAASSLDQQEKLKKRQERFGASNGTSQVNNNDKLKQRLERFKETVK